MPFAVWVVDRLSCPQNDVVVWHAENSCVRAMFGGGSGVEVHG